MLEPRNHHFPIPTVFGHLHENLSLLVKFLLYLCLLRTLLKLPYIHNKIERHTLVEAAS